MSYFKNREQLLSHGNIEGRKAALDLIDYALINSDPYIATKKLVKLEGNRLSVGDFSYNLDDYQRIFLIGGGKATFPIARALEEILGEKITDGVIICKYGQEGTLSKTRLYHAGHPIPDEEGYQATQELVRLTRQTQRGDLVFACITGGSSALMPYPVKGVTLDDKKAVNRLLLTCGADIYEINAVRKHLSRVKGGWLAAGIHPEVPLINLTVSDVVGDQLDYITCPTVPDTSYFDDARRTLTKYQLWDKAPQSVSNYLKNAGPDLETPKEKDLAGHKIVNFIIVPGDAAPVGAAKRATELGFDSMIISTMLEGESKEVGRTFAAIAREILMNNRPLRPPCVIIGGGETTVKIHGDCGQGGPNQEFALAASLWLDGIGDVVVVGQDTDGTDGPTEIAGGIVDNQTVSRARELEIDLFEQLNRHDVTPVFEKLKDAIVTGATGTNVNDLKIMVILPRK